MRYMIDAFGLLRQRYGERVELRLAGEGPERARLEAHARQLGIENAVHFHGWLEHEALPAFLRELDIFILPSLYEGFGVSATEASASELPVVASKVYGIPDVVKDGTTGLLVPPKDAAALADAIGRLVEDEPLRRRMGAAGRDFIATHYDWRENMRQLESIYEKTLAAQRENVNEAPTWQ
jgi:glycosyltransferase involved in cell wall biosynthesis